MTHRKFDQHLTEEHTRTLADWLTLAVFTQAPKSATQFMQDSNFSMPDLTPALSSERQSKMSERIVFVTIADTQGHYAIAFGRGASLAAAGEQALRQSLIQFATQSQHRRELLQQLIKRIKVDIVSDVIPLDVERVTQQRIVMSDRSLVGCEFNDFSAAWLAEQSLRHNWVTANGQMNFERMRKDAVLESLESASENITSVSIFGVISRLVLLNLRSGGQLEIENAPLLRNHRHAPELDESIALRAAQEGASYIARHTNVGRPIGGCKNQAQGANLSSECKNQAQGANLSSECKNQAQGANLASAEAGAGAYGSMNYMYDAAADRDVGGYNILRHCGSLWSMLQVYRDRPTVELHGAAHAALDYLRQCIVPFSENYPDAFVVQHKDVAKLGGNGLGLVALAAAYRELGESDVLPLMQGLARWITGTQSKTGQFMYHKIFLDTMREAPFQSDYYPGEAILGLLQLYKIDRDYRWLDAADRAARWLINVRDADKDIDELNRDHWLLYALNDLYRELPRAEFLQHTVRILDCIQQSQLRNAAVADLNGGFQNPLNVTATGCMCEGMMAGYTLLSDMQHRIEKQAISGFDESYLERLEQAIEAGLKLQLQYRFDDYNSTYLRNPARAKGGFQSTPRRWHVRVDFPQHSLTSFLMYWRFARR